jgi:hypothetical protein
MKQDSDPVLRVLRSQRDAALNAATGVAIFLADNLCGLGQLKWAFDDSTQERYLRWRIAHTVLAQITEEYRNQ